MKSTHGNQKTRILFGMLTVIFILMGLYYSYFGRVFLDAGFYLNAAREVYRGNMPYRDFFYVQGPVYPYVYGLPLYVSGYRILYARWISLCFGVLALILSGWTARRFGGGAGLIIAAVCLATVPSHAYYFSSVKLYALSGCLLMMAFAVLASGMPVTGRHSLGLVLAVLAAATRLTLLPALGVVLVYVIRDSYHVRNRFPGIAVLAASAACLSLSLPFLLADTEAVMYSLIGIHTSASEGPYRFAFSKQLKVLVKTAVTYPVIILAGLYGVFRCFDRNIRKTLDPLEWTMAASVLVVTLAHLAANWFSVGYQSVLMPLTASLAGGIAGRCVSAGRIPLTRRVLIVSVVIISGLITWRQHIWTDEPLTVGRNLDLVGRVLAETTSVNGSVAACSAVFAIHADRNVSAAFGGAPFTYTPGWSDEQCRRYGSINNSLFRDMLQRQEPEALLFEPESFAVGFPGFYPVSDAEQAEVFQAIETYYRQAGTLRSLGDGSFRLRLYLPRTEPISHGSH